MATTRTRIAARPVNRGRGRACLGTAARGRGVPRRGPGPAPGRAPGPEPGRGIAVRRTAPRGPGVRLRGSEPRPEGRPLGIGSSALPAVAGERGAAGVPGGVVELLLDAQQLVVLRDPLGAGGGTGLDLAAVRGDGEVGDGGVLGLAGAVAHHAAEAGAVREVDGVEGLG